MKSQQEHADRAASLISSAERLTTRTITGRVTGIGKDAAEEITALSTLAAAHYAAAAYLANTG